MSSRFGSLIAWLAILVSTLTACVLPPSTIPIATSPLGLAGEESSTLILFLHGRGGAPVDFEEAGFARIASEAGISAQMVLVDAHEGYYKDQTIVMRLREDIVVPARQRGQRVWLVGVSMGGTGALMYAKRHPGEVDGVLAIAPFLGSGSEIGEIVDAGGIASWSAGDKAGVFPWELWDWLKKQSESPGSSPSVYIGFGTSDRFARAGQLLAGVIPEERLSLVEGGHDWKTWARLWNEFVRSGALGT